MKNIRAILISFYISFIANYSVGSEVVVKVFVADDAGTPIGGLKVCASTWKGTKRDAHGWPDDDYYNIFSVSDDKGVASLAIPAVGKNKIGVSSLERLPGHYPPSSVTIDMTGKLDASQEIEAKIIVKRVLDPVPMYVAAGELRFPDETGPWDYDLIARDWMPPHGHGKQADWRVSIKYDIAPNKSHQKEEFTVYDATVTIEAIMESGGFIPYTATSTDPDDVRSPICAPETGYSRKIDLHKWVIDMDLGIALGKGIKINNASPSWKSDYMFKIASHDVAGGSIVGKIYEGFTNWAVNRPMLDVYYFINPNSHSRSLEWNKSNLFPSGEHRP